jgi:hypothetical protein
VALFGLSVGTIILFKIPGPHSSPFGVFLGYFMMLDGFIFLFLVFKWMVLKSIKEVLAWWARS